MSETPSTYQTQSPRQEKGAMDYTQGLAYIRHTRTGCFLGERMHYSPYLARQSVDLAWSWTTDEAMARTFLASVARQVAAVYTHITGDADVTIVHVEDGGAA